ncbi:NB-ARC domain containing protein [Trema orientale]|uniref:NB-ARC domain containing protein n=1 Tax=Trema orientale TaxID=63057 RepID=A0A2P5ETP7_TREOI|nr:NB-ARC domain containing protein [Trema orientale]
MVILYILISGLFFLLMVMISSYVTFQYLEENYTWISREWRLLDALSKDFQTAYRAVDQTKRRASQVWKSELNLRGLTLKLSQIETRWIKKAGKVASDAKRWAEELERLMAERREMDAVQRHVLVLKKVALIFELAFGLHRTKGDIKNQLDKNKKYTNYIIGLLEDSRIKVRRVQDRPIDDSRKSRVPVIPHPGPVVPLALERLIDETPNYLVGGSEMVEQIQFVLIQLQLLEAFMRDLRGLRLESNIESVWLEEARETNVQVQYDIKTFLVAASNQNRNVFSGWIWRRKFKQILKHVASELSHFLELKERYGFTFMKRVSSKGYAFRIPLPPNQTWIMDKIRSELIGMQDDQLINSLCSELEDAQKLLSDQEANQGATKTRMACFKVLRKRLKDTLKLLKDDEKALISMRRACFQLLKKMAPNAVSSREKKTKSLQKVVGLLKKCIQVYMISVVEDSCSVVGLEEDIHKLVWKLTADSEQGSIISIVGMRGIGKTTLAQEICTHRLVINRFSVCRLVSMREEYHHNNTLLLKSFGNQILDTQDERPEKEYWIKKIKDFLKEKCCLIVLDNLFSKEAWDYLHKHVLALEEMGNGSKIMLTTRSKEVATHANPSSTSIHRLRLRNREESWEFFTQMVHCPDTGLETLAKEVVARTGGLPLAILHLGYLLSWEKVTKEELSRALELVSQGQNQTPWLENRDIYLQLQSSSTVLDRCLSYFELFPRDFEVPVKRLVAL